MDNDDVDDLTSVASVLAQGTAAMAMENKRLDRPPFWDMMSPHLVDGHGAAASQATMSAAEAGAVAGRQFLWSSEWNRLKRTWDQACSSAALPAVVVCRDRSPVQPEPAEPGAELAPAEGSPPRKRRNDVIVHTMSVVTNSAGDVADDVDGRRSKRVKMKHNVCKDDTESKTVLPFENDDDNDDDDIVDDTQKTLAIAPDNNDDDDDSLLALLAKPIVPISKEERDASLMARQIIAETEKEQDEDLRRWEREEFVLLQQQWPGIYKEDATLEFDEWCGLACKEAEHFEEIDTSTCMESCTFDELFELVQELIKSNSLGTHYIGICRLPHERWNLMADHSHSRRFLKMFVLCFAKAAHLQCLERWLISSTRRWLSDKAKVTELIGCKSANKSAGGEGIKQIDRGFVYICFGL